MNTRDAAYLTGHHYPGGVPALAVRMGMDAHELSRKLNPNTGSLGLDEAGELGYTLTPQSNEADE